MKLPPKNKTGVQRYELEWADYEDCNMEKDDGGDYVLYSDYEKLQIKLQDSERLLKINHAIIKAKHMVQGMG